MLSHVEVVAYSSGWYLRENHGRRLKFVLKVEGPQIESLQCNISPALQLDHVQQMFARTYAETNRVIRRQTYCNISFLISYAFLLGNTKFNNCRYPPTGSSTNSSTSLSRGSKFGLK